MEHAIQAVVTFVVIAIVGLGIHMIREAYRTNLSYNTFKLSRLDQAFAGTQIFFISDIHRRKINAAFIDRIVRQHQIELVLIGGDLTEAGVALARTTANIKQLRRLAPIYMVHGNHDYEVDYRQLGALLVQMGVKVLDNEAVLLEKGEAKLHLIGVDDPRTNRDKLHLAFAEIDSTTECCILLAHDPSIVHKLKKHPPRYYPDLILSGHTHGGQVCLPWIGAIVTASEQPSPKYVSGHYTIPFQTESARAATPQYVPGSRHWRGEGSPVSMQLFISRGFGTSRLPIRLLCPAEAHVITLQSIGEAH